MECGRRPRAKLSRQGSGNWSWSGHAWQLLGQSVPPHFQMCPHQIERSAGSFLDVYTNTFTYTAGGASLKSYVKDKFPWFHPDLGFVWLWGFFFFLCTAVLKAGRLLKPNFIGSFVSDLNKVLTYRIMVTCQDSTVFPSGDIKYVLD